MRLFDAHCHLDFPAFDDDREQVITAARDAGISDIIIPGARREHWPRITQICEQHRACHPCYGLHPYWSRAHDETDLGALDEYLAEHDSVAVGECGLDFREQHVPDDAARRRQLGQFTRQLDIAQHRRLPVVIHAVRATQKVIDILGEYRAIQGMIHSYSGSLEQAERLVDMGFCISVGAMICHPRAHRLHRTVRELPLEYLLLETDAPDQPAPAHAGERNEPAYMTETLREVCRIREVSVDEVAERTTANARRLFNID